MSERITGTVKFYSHRKGYGFIIPTSDPVATSSDSVENRGIFVHRSDIHRSELAFPKPGEEVTYVVSQDENGRPKASEIERPHGIPFVKKPRARKAKVEGETDAPAAVEGAQAAKPARRRRGNRRRSSAPKDAAAPEPVTV